jgi:indole-3-glycerol phosphate synthase
VSIEAIIAAKQQALAARKAKTPIEAIRALASMQKRPLPVLSTITNGTHMTLMGQVCHPLSSAAYDPVSAALRLLRSGIDALALFTDDAIYESGLSDLTLVARAVNAPLITQDYVFDEYQVVEARAAGAAGVMLYANMLDIATVRMLVSAIQRNRMTAIVQVSDEDEIRHMLAISPQVIALHPEESLNACALRRLRPQIPQHIRTWITNPLNSLEEVQAIAALHPDALLLSTSLLEQANAVALVREALRQSGWLPSAIP